jgi:hypothetical protein
VCIKGALSYRGSHWDEEGENVFVRWPFRIDICYPFTRKGWEILLNVEKYNKD